MKTQEEIVIKAKAYAESIGNEDGLSAYDYVMGYNQCQEDIAHKDKWTFDEILDACYPTLGRGNDWATIAIRLKEQKANKQD